MKLLIATRSAHKLAEIREILDDVPRLEVVGPDEVGLAPDPAEAGLEPYETFRENAASKARWFHARTGLPTVADDSGLVVDALEGAPGVRSKRFAYDAGVRNAGRLDGEARDRANNLHLLDRLEGVPAVRRDARFVCEAVLIEEGGREQFFRGEAEGAILAEPQGDGGFGYDPLFFDPELGTTFACIGRDEKNARSHRGKAFRALAAHLRTIGASVRPRPNMSSEKNDRSR